MVSVEDKRRVLILRLLMDDERRLLLNEAADVANGDEIDVAAADVVGMKDEM